MKTYQLSQNTLMERIRLYYIENHELSEADNQIMIRWEAAHALIISAAESDRNIVNTLMKRFDISMRTAYSDLRNALMLFGDVRLSTKEGIRYLVTQWSLELYAMAKQSKNLPMMQRALERLTKANNIDKEDMDYPDASKIQPPVQLLSVNFNFINSPMFKLIDETAQKALLQLYDEFMDQVKISPLAEYTDMFKIDDSVRTLKK
jgi:hypothetical protein